VFVSYATADRKQALAVCEAIERRGPACWLSTRDVEPGQNYQEAIVRSIRDARAMVLVFSEAANNSDEIKKELSLASRYHVPVLALRIEDVEPSDAFAYELSTRQWIDAFDGWDRSIDSLVRTLTHLTGAQGKHAVARAGEAHRRLTLPSSRRPLAIIAAFALVLGLAGAAWWSWRPAAAPASTVQVRLAAFERLSPDLPAPMADAVRAEFVAAFPQDGNITVSTAPAPPPGDARSYAISGTLRRDGDKVRAIARLTDERSGAAVWSRDFEYPAGHPDKLPRWFAVNAAQVIKCGLSGAASYPKLLPQSALSSFFSACDADSGAEQLDAARRAVAAAPDFSAGWSMLARAANLYSQASDLQRQSLRKEAREATEKAIRLDPQNGDAYVVQNHLLPRSDLIGREALLRKAVERRSFACACEHQFYGWLLWEVGKVEDASQELQRAVNEDPFNIQARTNFAQTLLLQGYSPASADEQYKIAADMVPDADFLDLQRLWSAPITGDYATAVKILSSGHVSGLPPDLRAALLASYKAAGSRDPAARQNAAAMLEAVTESHKIFLVVLMLGALGANRAALDQMVKWDSGGNTVRARLFLWFPTMRGVISDPGFPAVAERMGLMKYWRTTHTRPDVCSAKDPPAFCRMI
jgi:tetratricopeptide (TPR) repeat protein